MQPDGGHATSSEQLLPLSKLITKQTFAVHPPPFPIYLYFSLQLKNSRHFHVTYLYFISYHNKVPSIPSTLQFLPTQNF